MGCLGFFPPRPFLWHSHPGRLVTQAFLNEHCRSPMTSAAWLWIPPAFSEMIFEVQRS